MGYPMTYRRVVNRNRLAEGDYSGLMDAWWSGGGSEFRQRIQSLLGDLRRLEKDAVDEGAICQSIARKTGIDPNIVAVVLQEFMEVR